MKPKSARGSPLNVRRKRRSGARTSSGACVVLLVERTAEPRTCGCWCSHGRQPPTAVVTNPFPAMIPSCRLMVCSNAFRQRNATIPKHTAPPKVRHATALVACIGPGAASRASPLRRPEADTQPARLRTRRS
ncbi:hypothetical protein PsYK624_118830 [Phanerochaete sordida]|uniref:Uncharacterized protein n=1 Tax=Phanerochaete sordida TaxID=48140 RepID=A0A9P3LIZ6_9APHY|nr:hypothetical protein PsYK624_118830 [Phanerochaete sordida]